MRVCEGQDRRLLFIDEAYDLSPASSAVGKTILADIMSAAEEFRDTVTIILAGYKDDIDKEFFAFNVGMASRFQTIPFEDFTEDELRQTWRSKCESSQWRCDDNVCTVASRRLARGIGRKGFSNAREVRSMFEVRRSICC